MRFLQPPKRILYIKELPFHFNKKAMRTIRTLGEFMGIVLLTAFIVYILLNNFVPFGVTTEYNILKDSKNISDLSPDTRVKKEINNGDITYHQFDDSVYFTTKMPYLFDTATVKITFYNPDPAQTVSLGFRDMDIWHYNTTPIDVPYLNTITWDKTDKNPTLYQREKNFNSIDDFFSNPPKELLIGTYDYETNFETPLDPILNNYQPSLQETVIDVPLRGKHIMYVYLNNEPFKFIIHKQDLNWYEDPDPMTVKIYKDNELVYEQTTDDEGIVDNSNNVLPPQEITIQNPGPDLPEPGIYKIVLDAGNDTIIKQIKTNLHKIVFANSIFPAENHEAYNKLFASTSATTVYTNALLLSAFTNHNSGLQEIQVDNQILSVDPLKSRQNITPQENITKVVIPKNDVILNGFQGYFAFSENQFFLPTPYRIIPITSKEDLDLVDYVLTNYNSSQPLGDYRTNEVTFDIRSAVIKDGKLSWKISAPGLKESGKEILIKDISITFHKKPWM